MNICDYDDKTKLHYANVGDTLLFLSAEMLNAGEENIGMYVDEFKYLRYVKRDSEWGLSNNGSGGKDAKLDEMLTILGRVEKVLLWVARKMGYEEDL